MQLVCNVASVETASRISTQIAMISYRPDTDSHADFVMM